MMLGSDFLVSSGIAQNFESNSPEITTLSNGNFAVIWYSEGRMFGHIYTKTGELVGNEISLFADGSLGGGLTPVIAATNDGHFVIAYHKKLVSSASSSSLDEYGVFAQIYAADGSTAGSEIQVSTTNDHRQFVDSIAVLANGDIGVVWRSYNNTQKPAADSGYLTGTVVQLLSANGAKKGAATQVLAKEADNDIAALAGGGFAVTLSEYQSPNHVVHVKQFESTNIGISETSSFSTGADAIRSGSKIAVLSNGDYVVAWTTKGADGDGNGIAAQRFSADGNALGSEFQVNSTTADSQILESISGLDGGGFVVTWTDHLKDGNDWGVFAQKFDAGANRVGEEFQVNSYATGRQDDSVVTDLGDGSFVIAWDTKDPNGGQQSVYAKIIGGTQSADLSKVTYESLQVDNSEAWHDGTKQLTYSFLSSEMPAYIPDTDVSLAYGGDGNSNTKDAYLIGNGVIVSKSANFGVTADQVVAIKHAVASWNELANINLSEGTTNGTQFGDITFGSFAGRVLSETDNTSVLAPVGIPGGTDAAFASYPDASYLGEAVEAGDIWFNQNSSFAVPTVGTDGYITILHEIGHAIGLSHPNNAPDDNSSPQNTNKYTIMSYLPHDNRLASGAQYSGQSEFVFVSTPMLIDVQAIQELYGANQTTRTEDNVYFGDNPTSTYTIGDGGSKIVTVWDASGNDTFDGSNQSESVDINLNPGQYSTIGRVEGNIAIASNYTADGKLIPNADSAWIENAQGGSGDDTLIGNILSNRLTGGKGDDLIGGGEGSDTSVYLGSKSQFSISFEKDSLTIVKDRKPDGEGQDLIEGIERLEYANSEVVDLSVLEGVVNVSSADLASFIEIYIAYFNRAPDAEGLFYWGTRLSEGMSKNAIAESFYVQPETQALYTNPADTQGFVTTVYQNFLGRAPDTEGFNYWVKQLDDGLVSKPLFLLAIINGAKASTGDPKDVDYFTNKANIGAYFSVIKGMSNVDNAKAAMALYDGTGSSLSAAKNAIDGFYASALDANNGEMLINLVGVMDDPFVV